MEFGGKHAEAVFIQSTSVEGAKRTVAKVRQAVADAGRDPRDVKVVILLTVVVAPTDEEAQAKYRKAVENAPSRDPGTVQRLDRHRHVRVRTGHSLAVRWHQGGAVDGGHVLQGRPGPGLDPAPDRRIPRRRRHRSTIVGSPETVAAELRRWRDEADVDGINLSYTTKPGSWEDFIELALPELRAQGLISPARAEDQEPVTLREKLFPARSTRWTATPRRQQRAKHLSDASR